MSSVIIRIIAASEAQEFRPLWSRIFADVAAERLRQNVKWGKQRHPHWAGSELAQVSAANQARNICDLADGRGFLAWEHILSKEFHEAVAERDLEKRRDELIQVIAVAVAEIEQIYEEQDDG